MMCAYGHMNGPHTHKLNKLNNKVSHRQNSSFYQTFCCPHGGKSYVSEQKKKKNSAIKFDLKTQLS